ncbi:MAG: hypothetical protein AAGD07_22920 [Planctomycetota bacterium]
MLDFDYSKHYAEVVQQTKFSIDMPEEWSEFFTASGVVHSNYDEKRCAQRKRVRTTGLAIFENTLPFLMRVRKDPVGIYTKDFSKLGCGFLSPIEMYPEERVRLLFPAFWLTVKISRTQKRVDGCFLVGAELICRRSPSRDAFQVDRGLVGV